MKRTSKLILSLAMSAAMAFGVIGFAACTSGENGKSAYEIAVDNGFQGTEQEWLESLKGVGTDGKDGKDGVDGKDGTNGKDGKDGVDGKDGNGWHYGNGEPAEEVGTVGDLYLDLENGDVWTKEPEGWQKSELNVKGGEQSEKEPEGTAITISANETADISINLEAGVYELKFTLDEGVTAVVGGLTAHVDGSTAATVYDMYDGLNGTYSAVLTVLDDSQNITLTNTTGEDISAKYTLETYEAPTLKPDGTEYVVPLIYAGNTATYQYRAVFLPIESLTGTYRISVTIPSSYTPTAINVFKNGDASILTGRLFTFSVRNASADPREVDFTGITSLFFASANSKVEHNITVKIEPVTK